MKDEGIVAAIQRGDEAAINDVIEHYFKLMWSIVSTILKNVATTQDIEECVADVFVYFWQNAEKYDARRGRLKVWLSVVARSRAINKYRQITRHSEISLEDLPIAEQLGLEDGVLAAETNRTLSEAVRALHGPEREIVVRRYYYGQKPKEIATALDMPVKQVDNHLYRAKQKLRQLIS